MSIESVRKRLEAATPGPWLLAKYAGVPAVVCGDGVVGEDNWVVESCGQGGCEPSPLKNAVLIAHAPTDLALALDALSEAAANHDNYLCSACTVHTVCALKQALDAFESSP